ncbi:MAG: MarR family winged helix-turn-helix transcriptional regulator [Pseudomonadota bacterium]
MSDKQNMSEELLEPGLGLCAHANLRQATRVISQVYDAALKLCGIKATQFTLLAVLANRGEMPLTKLAEILVMDRTTLSRNLQPLVKKGWLSIGREKDERIKLISLTEAGVAMVDQSTPLWRKAQMSVIGSIGASKLPRLVSDLNRLVNKVQAN